MIPLASSSDSFIQVTLMAVELIRVTVTFLGGADGTVFIKMNGYMDKHKKYIDNAVMLADEHGFNENIYQRD